jgi:ribosomal protein S18 acetylase RimI-like enzyme
LLKLRHYDVRSFKQADTEKVARVWHQSGIDEYTYLPDFQALSFAQAVEIFVQVIVAECDIWVCEDAGEICGFLAIKAHYIDRLYVAPGHQRRGVGSCLMDFAKQQSPAGLALHTHQQNQRARGFYEKHGFFAVGYGISPPPECVPDVEYHWRSVKHLR